MITYAYTIRPEDYIHLRQTVGWTSLSLRQAKEGLAHTAHVCAAVDNGTVVGMSRFLFDYGYVGYISDVIVTPEYQGIGIGKHMVQDLLSWIETCIEPGEYVQIVLAASKGREPFYYQFGFSDRPDATTGAGMMKRIQR
jgi:ribosomal protein S18 acetylase RimI-like enzyme